MNTPALSISLEDTQGRNPIGFPFGFYLEDNYDNSVSGSFFWYSTAKEMQLAIKNDLIDKLSDAEEDATNIVKTEIGNIFESLTVDTKPDELLQDLNLFFRDLEVQLQFVGSFEELCKGKHEWIKFFRESYREECLEDIEDITTRKLQSTIKKAELNDFSEYVADYYI